MKIEDIEVGGTYYYDNASDVKNHGREFEVTDIKVGKKVWPVIGYFTGDPRDPDHLVLLDPPEVSMFPIGVKRTADELDHEYRDRLRGAIQKLERSVVLQTDEIEYNRLEGKIDGVKLALSYWEEMNR